MAAGSFKKNGQLHKNLTLVKSGIIFRCSKAEHLSELVFLLGLIFRMGCRAGLVPKPATQDIRGKERELGAAEGNGAPLSQGSDPAPPSTPARVAGVGLQGERPCSTAPLPPTSPALATQQLGAPSLTATELRVGEGGLAASWEAAGALPPADLSQCRLPPVLLIPTSPHPQSNR